MRSGIPGFSILLFGCATPLLYLGLRNLYRSISSEKWASVKGSILNRNIEESENEDSVAYEVSVRYQYEVNGERYSGDRFRFGKVTYKTREQAELETGHYHWGQEVEVFYNPANPSESVLQRRTGSSARYYLGFGALLLAVAVAAAVWGEDAPEGPSLP